MTGKSPPTSWEFRDNKLHGSNGEQYDVVPHQFWYAAPARITYKAGKEKVRPLEFALTLHNAALGRGLIASPAVILHGLELSTTKSGVAAEAESFLETVRKEEFPNQPSRLCCYFLNLDRTTAEFRMKDSLRGNRVLTPCFIVVTAGSKIHFADTDVYERLEGRPEDRMLARSYWQRFTPKDEKEARRLEILAETALFFPEWTTFPTLDPNVLLAWRVDNPSNGSGNS